MNSSYDWDQVYVIAVAHYYNPVSQLGNEVINAKRIKLTDLQTTNLSELEYSLDFKIYPNPTDLPFTNVEFRLNENAPVQARIMDVTGKVVSIQDFGTMSQGNQMIQVDTDHLENGFYFLNLIAGGQEVTRKFSVLK